MKNKTFRILTMNPDNPENSVNTQCDSPRGGGTLGQVKIEQTKNE